MNRAMIFKTGIKLLSVIIIVSLLTVLTGNTFAKSKQYGVMDTKSGALFVPLRLIADLIGAELKSYPNDRRLIIQKDDKSVEFTIGQLKALVDGKTIAMNAAPFIDGGVTYVPLKPLSLTFHINIEWRPQASSVYINRNERTVILPVIHRGSLAPERNPIVSEKKVFNIGKKSFAVQMVTILLLDPRIELDIALAHDKIGKVEELSGIAKRNGAILAINGTFFNAYTDSDYKNPYGYLVNDGNMLHKSSGDLRTIFTFDENHFAELLPGGDFPDRFQQGTVDGALQAGPRLIKDGAIALDVKAEGFKDPKILTGGGARSALGITKDHKLIFITSSGATIPQLAEIMKQAGAYQAMNLDGGASSGLYYDSKYLTKPGRLISNAIVVTMK